MQIQFSKLLKKFALKLEKHLLKMKKSIFFNIPGNFIKPLRSDGLKMKRNKILTN